MKRMLAIVFTCLLFTLPAPLRAAPAAQQTQVQPPAGPPGTRFVFVAGGFTADERLSAWVNAPDGSVREQRADVPERARSDGVASWNWVPPAEYGPGFWQIVVHGRTSTFEQVLTFQITAAEQPAATSEYNITPPVGSAGTIFRFYATGFAPGERVDTYALTPNDKRYDDDFIINVDASESGRLDGSWTAPINVPAYGTWQIVMAGRTSGVTQTIPFKINQLTAPTATPLQVSPSLGKPGMRFLFYTSGFQPKEIISTWLNAPDGTVVPLNEYKKEKDALRALSDGRVGWQWVAPFDVQVGTWTMVARGKESGIEQVVQFRIEPGL